MALLSPINVIRSAGTPDKSKSIAFREKNVTANAIETNKTPLYVSDTATAS